MPLKRRVPKRGFNNPSRDAPAIVNIGQLDIFTAGSEVTPALLQERGVVRRNEARIKILGDGSLSKALTVKAHSFSSKAKEKIEASGGKAELIIPHA